MNIDINNYLRIDPVDMALVCISTLILCLVAKHFFWDQVLAYFDARQNSIQEEIDEGTKAKQSGEAYKKQYETQIANVKQEANILIEEAKLHAKNESRIIINNAKHDAQVIKDKAKKDIEQEKLQAKKEMEKAIRDIAFEAAEKIVEKEIDDQKQQEYVDDFIGKIGDQTWN